ncbi:C39 family peptidase [Hyalangium versicolor]|uniref:C39 family peptidase n=1 Tax=Hyalangium versicolor TaxID=2861190 RepID=UPI001CCEEC03|nr:papain-like cysteine protease family protein [Hyalangium versicolor]
MIVPRLLKTLVPCLLALSSLQAEASTVCQQTPQGELCTSQVDFSRFAQQAYQNQYQSQWCWAASISMLYSYYIHPVRQDRIVSEVYGAPVNMPAQAGIVMARQLNRQWVDDLGNPFAAHLTGAYDADAGVLALTNQQIVSELDQDHPLVIGARGHAMVLTAIQYFRTSYGPNIVAGGVFDPWPGNGARGLATDELYPMHLGGSLRFVATVRVTNSSSPQPQPQPVPNAPEPTTPDYGCATSSGQGFSSIYCVVILALFIRLRSRT